MTCHDARELFSALVDEALDAGERGGVEAHLAACPECRRELERFRSTVALLRAIEPVRAPVGFVDRVLEVAHPAPWHRRLLSALFLPWPVKLPAEAAAVVLVVVGVVYLYNATPELQQASRMEPAQAPTEMRRQSTTETPIGAIPERARPAASPAPPASPRRATRELMEKEGLKDASRDADKRQEASRPAPPAESRVEGKLETAPPDTASRAQSYQQESAAPKSAQAPESRADAQIGKRSAAAPAGAASLVPPDVSGRLAVSDRDAALRGLDELVARLGAVVDRRLTGSDGPIVELTIARETYAEFVRELARLGRWQPSREPSELPAQIRIVLRITG